MTVSPSSVRISRSVVCVAGCCGPKLSVQWYSRSAPSATSIRSSGTVFPLGVLSRKRLTLRPGDDREVVAFAAAAERVVLAQRERGELLRHQDAAQVRVPV